MRKVDPERQAAQRGRILEAAAECFARRGFHGTSTAEICAAASMSPGNLFHYYPSKDALIEALVDADRQAWAGRRAGLEEGDAASLLGDLVEEELARISDPGYRRLAMEVMAESVRNPRIAERVARDETARKEAFVGLLRRAVKCGQAPAGFQAAPSADWLLLLLDGAFSRAVVDPAFKPRACARRIRAAVAAMLKEAP